MKYGMALVLMFLLSACSRPSAEEYFAAGEAAQRDAEAELGSNPSQDSLFRAAIGQFERLAGEYPDHPLAQVALFRVAELHNNGTRDFAGAIDAYRRYSLAYPETPQAPVSVFMMGFVYNNELRNVDSAGALYRRFIARYPDHELATSARAELENLGKSPEEIIESRLALSNEDGSATGRSPGGSRKK